MPNKPCSAPLALFMLLLLMAPSSWASPDRHPVESLGQDLVHQLRTRAARRGNDLGRSEFVVTTPANLDNLDQTSPLARCVAEDLSMWLVRHGYSVKEIRRSDAIVMEPGLGEMGLTRDPDSLYKTTATGTLLVTGTYTVVNDQVLFHIRIVEAGSNRVLAMGPLRLTRTSDTDILLTHNDKRGRTSLFTPTVKTSLPVY
ncbi:FlgO family outer membrane protein [Desulfoplanes sp.]